jgi:hypothetical protein
MTECEYCDEEFDSKKERLEHELSEHKEELTGHEKDEKKSELSKLEDQDQTSKVERNRKMKRAGIGVIGLLILAGGGFAALQSFDTSPPTTNESIGVGTDPVHWHADYQITVCGEDRVLRDGPMLAHTHGEKSFHLEGRRTSREQATLGWVANQLGAEFSNSGILGYEEPESCPGTEEPGNLTVEANGETLEDPENYILRDGDMITITYE